MAKKVARDAAPRSRMRPATTPEARENQMIALAIDLAEQQLRDGTASSQVITHFLKLGSTRERIEKEILERQKDLVTAKTEALNSSRELKDEFAKAIAAFKRYSGNEDDEGDEDVRSDLF